MPFATEHACRVRDPRSFTRFRRQQDFAEVDGKQVDVIFGIKGGKSEIQSWRYPLANGWSESAARTHCTEHDGLLFEPAEPEEGKGKRMSDRLTYCTLRKVGTERRGGRTVHKIIVAANQKSRNPFMQLDLKGVNFDNYRKNPIVLWNHDDGSPWLGGGASSGLPIGRTLEIGRNKEGQIVAKFEFLPNDEFVKRVENAWNLGFLQAASIRWMPLEIEELENGDAISLKSDMLEWSIVPIPADPDTLKQAARSAGLPPELFLLENPAERENPGKNGGTMGQAAKLSKQIDKFGSGFERRLAKLESRTVGKRGKSEERKTKKRQEEINLVEMVEEIVDEKLEEGAADLVAEAVTTAVEVATQELEERVTALEEREEAPEEEPEEMEEEEEEAGQRKRDKKKKKHRQLDDEEIQEALDNLATRMEDLENRVELLEERVRELTEEEIEAEEDEEEDEETLELSLAEMKELGAKLDKYGRTKND